MGMPIQSIPGEAEENFLHLSLASALALASVNFAVDSVLLSAIVPAAR